MKHLAAGTIAAKSYLSSARVLAESFRRHHPGVPFFVLLADEVNGYFQPAAEPFELLHLSDLGIPHLERFRFAHAQQPLTYAATPYLLDHLLDRGFSRLVFLKQESLVVGDLSPIFDLLERHSVLLTPHLLAPLRGEGRADRELDILRAGAFNVGFLGVSDRPPAREFLAWWRDRLTSHCRLAVEEGLHFEQRWIDLVPALFQQVHVVRDPGCNVGHWNLPEREVRLVGDAILVDGRPCSLFRFSGFEPDRALHATRHSRRLTMANVGPAAEVFERYLHALAAAGYDETRRWPYAYGHFDNGVAIPDVARRVCLDLQQDEHGDGVERFDDPFAAEAPHSFFRWLNQPVDETADPSRVITRLWGAVYRQRHDLHQAFPDIRGSDRDAFLDWTVLSGTSEYSVPESFQVHRTP